MNAEFIKDITIDDMILHGVVFFQALDRPMAVELDPEAAAFTVNDFAHLIGPLRAFVNHSSRENLLKLRQEISKEITESAYEQGDYKPEQSDFAALEQDLELVMITVFPDGFSLEYTAEKIFPGNEIRVQLDDAFKIEDITIHEL